MRTLRMFPTMLRVGFAELVAYRGEVLIWILTTTMPLIMYAMWSTIAREAPVGRFDESTFAAYFLSTLIVRQLASAWIVWELNYLIKNGQLSTLLLRPVHPLYFYAAQNLGALPFRAMVLAPLAVGAWILFPKMSFALDPLHLGLYVITILFAWLLTFLIQSMFGLLALYTQQSLSFQEAWFGLWALLSGYLIPLDLMPGGIERVANWLPFRAMGSLPTEILLGLIDGPSLLQGLAAQMMWVVICLVVVRAVWTRAIRRFEAYGG